jgi:hypothetical protein
MYLPPVIGVIFLIIIVVARIKIGPKKVIRLALLLFITMALLTIASIYVNTIGIRWDLMTGHVSLEVLIEAWDYYWQPIIYDCLILSAIYIGGVYRNGEVNAH